MIHSQINQSRSWTWADLLSTHRFWALVLFSMLAAPVPNAMGTVELHRIGVSLHDVGRIYAIQNIAFPFALFLAWAAIRSKRVSLFFIFALLQIAGAAMLYVPSSQMWVRFAGSVIFQLGVNSWMFAIPAVLAGACEGAEAFVVAYGSLFVISSICNRFSYILCGMMTNAHIPFLVQVEGLLIVGLLCMLPIKRCLFNEPPPDRNSSLPPIRRNPTAVGFMSLIPFYPVYWMYRVHGEVASIAPSRTILTPRAAALYTLFIPLLYVFSLTALLDALLKRSVNQGNPSLPRPWVVVLWCLLLPPVAFGIVQSAINQSIDTIASESGGALPESNIAETGVAS